MAILLSFDTETTGIPIKYDGDSPHYKILPCYENARMLQIAWCISSHINSTDTILKMQSYIISNNFKIDNSHIHGITAEVCQQKGVPIEFVIDQFYNDLQNIRAIVGHNVEFDLNMLKSELYRILISSQNSELLKKCESIISSLEEIENFDTMMMAYKMFKLKKWPKLTELHKSLFGYDFDGAHDAYYDVVATVKCFIRLCFGS